MDPSSISTADQQPVWKREDKDCQFKKFNINFVHCHFRKPLTWGFIPAPGNPNAAIASILGAPKGFASWNKQIYVRPRISRYEHLTSVYVIILVLSDTLG